MCVCARVCVCVCVLERERTALGRHEWTLLSVPHPMPQSWAEITRQTEGLSRLLRQHAEDLNAGPLSKLSLLIHERQQLRKSYSEQWQQLQQDLTKVGPRGGSQRP